MALQSGDDKMLVSFELRPRRSRRRTRAAQQLAMLKPSAAGTTTSCEMLAALSLLVQLVAAGTSAAGASAGTIGSTGTSARTLRHAA